jgi:hypothetical protein
MSKQIDKVLREPKKTKHLVLKDFTLDKLYIRGDSVELTEGKAKKNLITNKYIK